MLQNVSALEFVQCVLKYASNITGGDPYWSQRCRELTTQANQQNFKSTLFWTFSAAHNHQKQLM